MIKEVAKAGLFLILLIPVGLRVLPWMFDWIAGLRSREVFVLSVGVAALGLAYSATFFGLSLALGAFVAGIVVGESGPLPPDPGRHHAVAGYLRRPVFRLGGDAGRSGFVVRNLPVLLLIAFLIVIGKSVISSLIALWMEHARCAPRS